MLTRFVENFIPSIEERKLIVKVPLNESQTKLMETLLKNIAPLPENKVVYKIPISRWGVLNGNKRRYSRELWERVIKEQSSRYLNSLGLADHPPENSDGNFKEVFCVYHGLELSETDNLVFAYMTPVGAYGKLFTEILESNGKVGTSTSGFGELSENNEDVNPVTFELERIADCVLTPSQNVYGDKTMVFQTPDGTKVEITPPPTQAQAPAPAITGMPCGVTEPVQTTPEPQEPETISISDIISSVQVSKSKIPAPPITTATNYKSSYPENNNRSKNMNLSKLEERKLEKDISSFFEEAKQEKNPIVKATLLKEVLGFFNDISGMTEILKGLKEAVTTELDLVSKDVHSKIEQSLKIEEETGVKTVEDMKAGLDKIVEATQSFNENADHWKQVAGTLQKNVESLKAKLSSNPSAKDYEAIVRELEKTDIATRKIVDAQNQKLYILKKRLFEERNLSRKLEGECSEVTAQLEVALSAKKSYKEKAVQFRDAYLKIAEKNKTLVADKNDIINQVSEFLEKDSYQFGRAQKISGSIAEQIGNTVDFTQRQYVESYYNDLERQYGERIQPFREQIIARKTYKEAVSEFTRIFAQMDEFRIPKGIEGDERREFLKEHGLIIKDKHKDTKNAIRQILEGYRKVRE